MRMGVPVRRAASDGGFDPLYDRQGQMRRLRTLRKALPQRRDRTIPGSQNRQARDDRRTKVHRLQRVRAHLSHGRAARTDQISLRDRSGKVHPVRRMSDEMPQGRDHSRIRLIKRQQTLFNDP